MYYNTVFTPGRAGFYANPDLCLVTGFYIGQCILVRGISQMTAMYVLIKGSTNSRGVEQRLEEEYGCEQCSVDCNVGN